MLSRSVLLWEWEVWVNWFKTEDLWQKSFLQIVVIEWSSENLWNMRSTDVKANKNKKKIKDLALSYKFLQDVPSKLEMQYERGMYFSFDFGWYSIHFDCPLRTGGGLFLLNWQNLLSMESDLSTVPKWAIPENTNIHEWVRWVYGTATQDYQKISKKLFFWKSPMPPMYNTIVSYQIIVFSSFDEIMSCLFNPVY